MIRLDMEKVTGGVIVKFDFNPPKTADETDEQANARFAGKQQWAKLACMDLNANRRYQKRMEVLSKPYRRQIQLGTMDDDKADEIALKGFLEMILLDWGNIPIPGAVPFNVEGARKILSEPEWRIFYADLRDAASNVEEFAKVEREEDVKN